MDFSPSVARADEAASDVWSPDVENAFKEATLIYPLCGSKKVPGTGCGRNQLIALYISRRTGKVRTRKQVSSHIQVLARRAARARRLTSAANNTSDSRSTNINDEIEDMLSTLGVGIGVRREYREPMPEPYPVLTNPASGDMGPFGHGGGSAECPNQEHARIVSATSSLTPSTRVESSTLTLREFTAFIEWPATSHPLFCIDASSPYPPSPLETIDIGMVSNKFPGLEEVYHRGPSDAFFLVNVWTDLRAGEFAEKNTIYGTSQGFGSSVAFTLSCSTKVYMSGELVAERLETEMPQQGDDEHRFLYILEGSSMCSYFSSFIRELKGFPNAHEMNSVLENAAILQVVSNRDTGETLLCIAYSFAVSPFGYNGHSAYRLVKA